MLLCGLNCFSPRQIRRDNSGLEGDDGLIECDQGVELKELLERIDTM